MADEIEVEICNEDESALLPGTLLCGGRYRIVRFLSSGGFGKTYEAEHVLLHKRIAVKEFFPRDMCNRDKVTSHVTVGTESKRKLVEKLHEKFVQEAQAVAQFSHPGIVKVSDVFEENGTAYYVMDYIEGGSLRDKVKSLGHLSEADAVRYIHQVCDALAYVHSLNRLHLDIKPGNIMVGPDGHAILIDFGSSKQYDEVSGENTSTLLGYTAGYAPPEQTAQVIRTFYPATDIYAVGATLYNLLTGKVPVESSSRSSGEELDPLPANISAGTRAAVEAAMRLNKQKRPQSVAEFLELLDDEAKPPPLPPNVDDGETTTLPGSIRVLCSPTGAEIKIDGTSVGITPRIIDGIAPGQRLVTVSKAGYESKTWIVDVSDGATSDVSGSLQVVSQPSGSNQNTSHRQAQKSATNPDRKKRRRRELLAVLLGLAALVIFAINGGIVSGIIVGSVIYLIIRPWKRTRSWSINGHEYVDLGLTVKWATCNIGAKRPSDYGNYYAWGETKTKPTYTEEDSKTSGKSIGDIAGNSSYDAARANWGGTWRLPTKAEIQELVNKCTWTWTTQGSHNGYLVIGPNGNSIFLPATGYREYVSILDGSRGFYSSSTPDESNSGNAYRLYFYKDNYFLSSYHRYWGHSVRPVSE